MNDLAVPDFFRRLWRLPTVPHRRGRKPTLDVETVVNTAVRLADEGGLEAATLPKVAEELSVTAMSLYRHVGSKHNDWVVSGDKTASGEAMLADDPHLGLATPSIWYQMHLEADDLNVEGVIFAGVPGIILGHNEDIAWGVTNTGPDVQQLYLEDRNEE